MKYGDFPQAVIKENVDYTVKNIKSVIKKYGPRESGNDNCLAAEKYLKREMSQFCDDVHFEEYKMAPKAFLHFTKIVAFFVIAAVLVSLLLTFTNIITFFIAQCIVGIVTGLGLLITVLEFLLYKQFMDPLYKKATGHNLVATRKPTGEVKKRIVISGHIDSAYEWRHIYYFKGPGMSIFMGGTIVCGIISFIIAIVCIICNFAGLGAFGDFMLDYSFYFHLITVIFMVTLYWFVDFKTISPGANDNLTGTFAAACALRALDMAGVEFENTEVVAMITDGEEAGLRGAKAFAKEHLGEYTGDVETVVLCCDTLTDLEYLNVYSRDMTGTVKNDARMSQLVMDSAKEAGYEDAKFASVFFGSSDAAAFSQAGIKATCLAAMDPTPADYYHNRRDTADRLVPEAIETGFKIVISTILNYDENGLPEEKAEK
ncbi:MAG: M28 family metallopeptidase [Clostridiales bacterium]|nr:M28 family metallopeptidase [Clostridiales bacterium]MCD7722765.1 M28 family metallopeptidase [Clostridiales bacterium]